MIVVASKRLENIINNMKCEYADKVYSNFIFETYKVGCLKEVSNIEINIAENMLTLTNETKNESVLYQTDLNTVWNDIEKCSNTLIEKLLKYD